MYDVAVVGGGPGGLMSAIVSAKLGLDVVLLEKSPAFGYPVHDSGATSYSTVEEFEIGTEVIAQEINGGSFVSPSGRVVSGFLDKRFGCILERQKLNKELAKKASNAGADILLPANVTSPVIQNGKVHGLKFNSLSGHKEIKARLVVDASGVSSVVARKVGLHPGINKIRLGYGAQYEESNVNLDFPTFIEFYFGRKVAPGGYGWIFPKGADTAYVGVGITHGDARKAQQCLRYFVQNHVVSSDRLRNAQPLEFHSGIFPVGPILDRFVFDGLIIVGDAACQASPLFGEGIRYALKAGKVAGEVAAEALENGDTSRKKLEKFERRVRKEIWPNYSLLYKIHLYGCSRKDEDFEKLADELEKIFQSDSGRRFLIKLLRSEITNWDITKTGFRFLLKMFKG